ncbi:MAG TPA: hypothetical protein VI541_04965, partial [Actinomycetota bacterium]|nr:hypothetical protein [Actinomycetota bacterium]
MPPHTWMPRLRLIGITLSFILVSTGAVALIERPRNVSTKRVSAVAPLVIDDSLVPAHREPPPPPPPPVPPKPVRKAP